MSTVNAVGVITTTGAELRAVVPRVDLDVIPDLDEVIVFPKSRMPNWNNTSFAALTTQQVADLRATAT